MRRSVITCLDRFRITAEEENGRITGLFLEDPGETSLVGRIYTGRVKNIVKNIRAAFVDIGGSQLCYLSLDEWEKHPLGRREDKTLREGDEILVQIEKDALKSKAPAVTTRLTFSGQYLVLMVGKKGIFVSSKLKDSEKRRQFKELLEEPDAFYSLIVRTNGGEAPPEAILRERDILKEQASRILRIWESRVPGTLLYEPEPAFLGEIFNNRQDSLEEVVTDQREVWEAVEQKARQIRAADGTVHVPRLRFYEDSYPLVKLYSLETALDNALKERVWLRSGGFLVIQPTEALVSIDVNTGKFDGRKNLEETFFKTNLEAAEEAARQLRLRNLSGIILVDFINMAEEEHKQELLRAFSAALEKDPVKVSLLGYTRLGLVELTRKKIRKPLHEIWKTS